MKIILFLGGVLTLLTTTGCLVADGGGRHDHGYYHERGRYYERRETVVVGPPAVVVRAPVMVVRPPEIIVR